MLTITQIAGMAGAGLAGAAYVPQISHLIRARCSAGISRLAFEVWLLASLLTTARAVAIHAGVFIALGGPIQIVATALIMLHAVCGPVSGHALPHPSPRPARGQYGNGGGYLRKRPWWPASGRPPGCCISRTRRHGRALPAHVPVLHLRTHAVTARSGRETDVQAVRSWPRSRIAGFPGPALGVLPAA